MVFGQFPHPVVCVTKDGSMEYKMKKLQIDLSRLGEWAV